MLLDWLLLAHALPLVVVPSMAVIDVISYDIYTH
jgi:hypothetical protein